MKKLFVALMMFLWLLPLSGQESSVPESRYVDYEQPRSYIIADISITGMKYLQPSYFVGLSGLAVGQQITIPGEAITSAMEKFWSYGLFSDVRIIINRIEGNAVYLEIQLVEQPRLSTLTLKGLNASERKEISEKIDLKPGNQVTENILNKSVKVIKDYFIDKGFLNCSIEIVQRADTTPGNKVFVDMLVDKGKKVRIGSIEFTGNDFFTDNRLKRTMKKTKEKSINFFKPSKYIEADYKEDRSKLIEFYNKNGYRDAEIIEEKQVPLEKNRIGLSIAINEGTQYKVRNITWVGNTKYPSENLSLILGLSKGDIYDQVKIQERLFSDDDAVTSQYMDQGYLFFSVEPLEANIDGDSIDLEMRVYEGPQATISNVIIKGNTKTNEHVIRRELRTQPGELFSKTNIVRSVRELAAMGHFNPETITPNPIPNLENGTVDIEYTVEERSNDQLEIQGGWGGYGFVGTVGLNFANFSARNMFDLKNWRPVPTGDGQTLSVRAQSNGKYYQAYNLSFVEPWFGGKKPNSFSFSLYHTITKSINRSSNDELKDDFFKVTGGSVGMGRRLTWPDDYFVLYNEIGYQRYHLNDWGSSFFINNGHSNLIDLTLSLSRSSQDQTIYPRRGSSFNLTLQLTPPFSLFKKDKFWTLSNGEKLLIRDQISNDNQYVSTATIDQMTATEISSREDAIKYNFIEYHKWTFNGTWYATLVDNLVLAAKAEFGYLGHYNADIGASPFEKFSLGGSGMMGYNLYGTDIVALRGYPEGSLTPQKSVVRNGSEVKIDNGNLYVKYSLELRYPMSLSASATFFGHIFVDAGNAWQRFNEFNPFSVKRSAGVGIRAYLPMFGMLGVDWGFGFDLPNSGTLSDSEIRKGYHGGEFHFVMGQNF